MGVDSHGLDIGDMLTTVEIEGLGKFLHSMLQKGMKSLEIGTWKGCSAKVIAEQMKQCGGKLICVDDWKGNGNAETLQKAKDEFIYNIFEENMILLGLWDVIETMVMTSEKASSLVEDNSLDFIFLDADHSKDEVMKDIINWMPKLKSDGIFCGHDLDHDSVRAALNEVLPNKYHHLIDRLWFSQKEEVDAGNKRETKEVILCGLEHKEG